MIEKTKDDIIKSYIIQSVQNLVRLTSKEEKSITRYGGRR